MNPFLSDQTAAQREQEKILSEIILSDILVQEQHCLEQLIQLLKAENTAIQGREIKSINHLLDKKLMLLSKLEQLDQQRQHLFEQQTKIPYSHSDFSHFIKQHPEDSIQNSWQAVTKKLSECKKQNEVNGRMIDIQKDNSEQILQILLGQPENTSQTYSHLGQSSTPNKSALYTEV